MILVAHVDDDLVNVPMDSATLLVAVLGVTGLGFLVFLYINRRWCFNKKGRFVCCNENSIGAKYVQKLSRKRRLEETSSDSEEEILRRLRLQQSNSNLSNLPHYGTASSHLSQTKSIHAHLNRLQHVKIDKASDIFRDPLGVAERGKVGLPISSSECSSNSSVEASVESNTGLVSGEKKDRILISHLMRAGNPNGNSPTLRESHIDNEHTSNGLQNYGGQYPIDESLITNGNQDCIVMLSQDSIFDTSDIKSIKSDIDSLRPGSPVSSISSRFGTIEISLFYDAPMRKMTIHVLQGRGLATRSKSQSTHTQVRLLMLPSKKQKHKTKIRSGDNPQFMESFLLHRINPEEVNSMGLRVRVYGCERMRRERLIGEAIVSFASIDLELETNLWLPLEPRAHSSLNTSTSDLLSLARSDSTGSTISMQHGGVPELLIGLAYNGITGRLSVEIVKGSHFRCLTLQKAPDTYVKLCLVSSIGQELARSKTSTRRGQPNPLFKETFVFQVALFQLNDVTLMISVYAKRNMKRNEMVGWFSLGLNSSGPEEMEHWNDMREMTRGEMLARWHILVDS